MRRIGLALYLIGLAAYGAAWMMLVFYPTSAWSSNIMGLMAPAYTPAIWLLGITLIGDRYTIAQMPFQGWLYPSVALLFLLFHNWHTWVMLER